MESQTLHRFLGIQEIMQIVDRSESDFRKLLYKSIKQIIVILKKETDLIEYQMEKGIPIYREYISHRGIDFVISQVLKDIENIEEDILDLFQNTLTFSAYGYVYESKNISNDQMLDDITEKIFNFFYHTGKDIQKCKRENRVNLIALNMYQFLDTEDAGYLLREYDRYLDKEVVNLN